MFPSTLSLGPGTFPQPFLPGVPGRLRPCQALISALPHSGPALPLQEGGRVCSPLLRPALPAFLCTIPAPTPPFLRKGEKGR